MRVSARWPVVHALSAASFGGVLLLEAGLPRYGLSLLEAALLTVPASLDLGQGRSRYLLPAYFSAAAAMSLFSSPPFAPLLLLCACAFAVTPRAAWGARMALRDALASPPPGRFALSRGSHGRAIASNLSLLGGGSVALLSLRLPALLPPSILLVLASLLVAFWGADGWRELDYEAPFLLLLSTYYSETGKGGLESAIMSFGPRVGAVFPALHRVRLEYTKLAAYFSDSYAQALERLRGCVRHELIASSIDGYLTMIASGGDRHGFLKDRLDAVMAETESRWLERTKGTRDAVEALLIGLSLSPALLVMLSAIGQVGMYNLYYVAALLPFFVVLVMILLDGWGPSLRDRVEIGRHLSVGMGAGALSYFALRALLHGPSLFLAALAVALSPAAAQYARQFLGARRDERDLLTMAMYMVESLRLGKGTVESMEGAAEVVRGTGFRSMITAFLARVANGEAPPLAGALTESDSWLVRASFTAFGFAVMLGSGVAPMERFRDFLRRQVNTWRMVRREMLWAVVLSASMPLVAFGGVSVVYSIFGSFSGLPGTGVSLPQGYVTLASYVLVEIAVLTGIVSSKLATFTVRAVPVLLATAVTALVSMLFYGLA
ncbi:MAG: hypothetical protein JRN39_00485 [Nitrososphaerota archaeon]|nr:hypothetical protein [Nitrososphaerota archaeon]MDG6938872.1 hypothetical protein [Nitrososphaerota archaeon]